MVVFKCLKDCYVEEGVEQSCVVLKGRIKIKGEKVIGKLFQLKKIMKSKVEVKFFFNEESYQQIQSIFLEEFEEGNRTGGQVR